jgi:hypothetical protein
MSIRHEGEREREGEREGGTIEIQLPGGNQGYQLNVCCIYAADCDKSKNMDIISIRECLVFLSTFIFNILIPETK